MGIFTQKQACLDGFTLQDLVDESIAFLREHEPPEGYFVGFSGGKDSIVTLELCRMAGVKHQAYYTCTRIDPPEIYKFIKANYPDVKWLFPKASFWSLIQTLFPPLRTQRWCCDRLKKEPALSISLKNRLMGIRAEESARRASRPRIDRYNKKFVIYKPIFAWKEWAVWEFIEGNSLPYPALYEMGLERIGCVCCPFHFGDSPSSLRKLAIYQKHWPGIWKTFEHAVKRWFITHFQDDVNEKMRIKLADEYWHIYVRGGGH